MARLFGSLCTFSYICNIVAFIEKGIRYLLVHCVMLNSLRIQSKADYLGFLGSVGCIIHCLITPVLVMTSTLLRDESLRVGFLSLDYLFIGINILAVWSASRHTLRPLAVALWIFLTLFATGLLLEEVDARFEYLAYAASLGLVVTHLINIRRHTH
jgi:hypothetical protein